MNPELEKAIAAIRAQGGTDADVEAYVKSIGGVEASATPAPPGKTLPEQVKASRTKADDIGAIAQTWSDASTFGASGLLDDLISSMSLKDIAPFLASQGKNWSPDMALRFRRNRDFRKASREELSGYDRTLATIGGALSNPVGAVYRTATPLLGGGKAVQAAATTARVRPGVIKTGLLGAREGATQGALTGFGENIGTSEGALPATVGGAVGGAIGGAVVPAAFRLGEKANNLRKIFTATPLGKVSQEMADRMAIVDEVMYGEVRKEAGKIGTSPAIREVLESQTIKPFADLIRKKEATAGLNDAETLIEAYKQMSRAQRRAGKATEGTVEHLAEKELDVASIKKAKGRLLDAAERVEEEDLLGEVPMSLLHPAGAPGLRTAVREHAESSARMDAYNEVGDAVRDVLYGKSSKMAKQNLTSPEALEKAIKQMNPEQASDALKAVYGRGKEVVRLTANPIGDYGIRPSIVHALRAPGQVERFVRLLEEQALLRSPFPSIGEQTRTLIPGLLGRTAGASQ